jgi:hypothetical protein
LFWFLCLGLLFESCLELERLILTVLPANECLILDNHIKLNSIYHLKLSWSISY